MRKETYTYRKIMLQILLALITIIFAGSEMRAETVSQKEASKLAEIFFNAANERKMGKPTLVFNGKKLTTSRLFSPFYVYNLPTGGFVIISAENKAFPILGYSLKDKFDFERLNEVQIALLSEYARDIERIRYDSRPVEQAFNAWVNIPEYVSVILNSPQRSWHRSLSEAEMTARIDDIIDVPNNSGNVSDIYDADQWKDLVKEDLQQNGNLTIGVIKENWVYPALVTGYKGDYFHIYSGVEDNWMMRLHATENFTEGQLADFLNPHYVKDSANDGAVSSVTMDRGEDSNNSAALAEISEDLIDFSPLIRNNGGGSFEIVIPGNVRDVKVYNISGALVRVNKYHDTNTAVINLNSEPSGFYVALVTTDTGRYYGVKLYK